MFGIFEILDYILPSTNRPKHRVFHLEYFCACKIMENDNNILKILPHIPDSMYESLLQAVIYKCYLEFTNIGNMSVNLFHDSLDEKEIAFPENLRTLILNWPRTELVLSDQIPSLHPPVEMFQNYSGSEMLRPTFICEVDDMLRVFELFCNKLIQFITKAVFKCTATNTQGFSCNLRRLDVSGLGIFCSQEEDCFNCFARPEDILTGIRNSNVDTFGHKIEIFADAEFNFCDSMGQNSGFKLLRNIIEESFNPNFGISVYFKKISDTSFAENDGPLPSDFYNVLALGRCEYIKLSYVYYDRNLAKYICSYLPKLVGINMPLPKSRVSLDFFNVFEYIEQIDLEFCIQIGLINSVCNMSKGLQYLNLSCCSLQSKDLECVANSIHADTLLELDLSSNKITNDSEAVALAFLFQKLNNVKVLDIHFCSLNDLSSDSVSKIVTAFIYCVKLDFLSMKDNPFSIEQINIIIYGLAQNKSLRYLSLDIPECCYNLGKTYHEIINKNRESPIYSSWRVSKFTGRLFP